MSILKENVSAKTDTSSPNHTGKMGRSSKLKYIIINKFVFWDVTACGPC
jgi:hypothetical protein